MLNRKKTASNIAFNNSKNMKYAIYSNLQHNKAWIAWWIQPINRDFGFLIGQILFKKTFVGELCYGRKQALQTKKRQKSYQYQPLSFFTRVMSSVLFLRSSSKSVFISPACGSYRPNWNKRNFLKRFPSPLVNKSLLKRW